MLKRHFSKIFVFILVLVSSISMRFYLEESREKYINKVDNHFEVSNLITNDIVETAMAVYNEYNSDYDWLVYPDSDERANSTIGIAFNNVLKEIYQERIDEKGLYFNVYFNDELIDSSKNYKDDEDSVIHRVIYIEDGDVKCDDNYGLRYYDTRYSDFSWLSDSFINRIFTSRQINAPYSYIYDCNINFPDGLKIDFMITDKLPVDSELYSVLMSGSDNLPYIIVFALILISLLLVLVMFFIPHRFFDGVNVLRFFRSFYIGPFLILYAILMSLGGFGLTIGTITILNGEVYNLLSKLSITNYGFAINLVLTLAYMAWFYMIVVGVDYVKEIFDYGFGYALKEKTLVCNTFRMIRTTLAKIFSFDFSNRTFVRLILLIIGLYCLLIFIPIVVFAYNWDFGFIFASMFFGLIVVIVLLQYNRYRNDYEILLKNTRGVASVGFKDYNFIEIGSFKEVQDELKNIREVIKKAVAEETKSQNMKTELITNVSHDLKTPITGMRNYLELLQDESLDDDKRREYIEIVNNYNNRLSRLVGDLFEVSKVNAGEYNLELMDLDVVSLVHQALVECADSFEERGLKSFVNTNKDKISLSLDGDKTYRIFENLLINISKYALANTRVYVDIVELDDRVEIVFKNISEVRIDIPAEKLTERFIRGDKSRSQSGSGLGLAIATSFTEIQNGKFRIETDGDLFKAIVIFYKQ